MNNGKSTSPATKSILLIGASGPTGRELITQMNEAGFVVRALVRNPARLPQALPENVQVAQGDVLNVASLVAAMNGVDSVVSALGTPLILRQVTLLSQGTSHLVDAMRQANVPRLLCITGMGAGDSRGHGGFLYDRLLLPMLLRNVYADKDRQEQVVKQSGLDWTLIRPARLVDTGLTGQYRVITQFKNEQMSTISRKDVAHFITQELRLARYPRQVANLTY